MKPELSLITDKLRKRLLEYLCFTQGKERSVHINSIEIVLCLVEFSVQTNPPRPISKEEERWFEAGYYLDMILRNSEWADLVDMYYALGEEVEKHNYFRGK